MIIVQVVSLTRISCFVSFIYFTYFELLGSTASCFLTKLSTLKHRPSPSRTFCFGEKILPSSE